MRIETLGRAKVLGFVGLGPGLLLRRHGNDVSTPHPAQKGVGATICICIGLLQAPQRVNLAVQDTAQFVQRIVSIAANGLEHLRLLPSEILA